MLQSKARQAWAEQKENRFCIHTTKNSEIQLFFWHAVKVVNVLEPNPNISCVQSVETVVTLMETNMPWCCDIKYELGRVEKNPSYNMIGNPIRLLRVAWDSTKLAVQVIAKNKQRAVVVSENQQAVAKQYRSGSYFITVFTLNVTDLFS